MKVSDKVVQSLRILIEQNNMQVGDRLPAERKLCEQLGVSRSSLREAIQQLSSMGMLLSKVGAGTFLQQLPTNWSQHQIVQPLINLIDQDPAYRFDVQEARTILEGGLLGMPQSVPRQKTYKIFVNATIKLVIFSHLVMMIRQHKLMLNFIWRLPKHHIIWC